MTRRDCDVVSAKETETKYVSKKCVCERCTVASHSEDSCCLAAKLYTSCRKRNPPRLILRACFFCVACATSFAFKYRWFKYLSNEIVLKKVYVFFTCCFPYEISVLAVLYNLMWKSYSARWCLSLKKWKVSWKSVSRISNRFLIAFQDKNANYLFMWWIICVILFIKVISVLVNDSRIQIFYYNYNTECFSRINCQRMPFIYLIT